MVSARDASKKPRDDRMNVNNRKSEKRIVHSISIDKMSMSLNTDDLGTHFIKLLVKLLNKINDLKLNL